MSDVHAFVEEMHPRLVAADTLLHNGDATERIAMWSRNDPVSLFGAAFTATGWDDILAIFHRLAARFSNCESETIEVVAAGVSTDLAYIASIERTTASVARAAPTTYALRVTTIFRREDGEWKVVHRHGDPYDDAADVLKDRLQEQS